MSVSAAMTAPFQKVASVSRRDRHIVDLASALIKIPSVGGDNGCMDVIARVLEPISTVERFTFGDASVLFTEHCASSEVSPTVLFLGHTDVVPYGNLDRWTCGGPCVPCVKNGYLYGRGSVDMKGPLAAKVIAYKRLVNKYPKHAGRLAFLIVDDEERPGAHGTKDAILHLLERGYRFDYCIAGEPSSDGEQLGNRFKYGCRGCLTGDIRLYGKSGHIGYPAKAVNANRLAAMATLALYELQNAWDPDTTLEIPHMHGGEADADNRIPGDSRVMFNVRYSGAVPVNQIELDIHCCFAHHGLTFVPGDGLMMSQFPPNSYTLQWVDNSPPSVMRKGTEQGNGLIELATEVIRSVCGVNPRASIEGGIGDFRTLLELGTQAIEFGPNTDMAHVEDERIAIPHLGLLAQCYYGMAERLLVPEASARGQRTVC